MQNQFTNSAVLTLMISTVLLLGLGSIIVYFLFTYQKKSYRHQQELLILRESFNKTLLESRLEIQEQTLDHIAKELHANFSHILSVININLSTLPFQDIIKTKEQVADSKSLVKQLMAEMKTLSVSLNTDHIMHTGFRKMLSVELERLNKTKRYKVSMHTTGVEYRLSSDKEVILFRMFQEILNNTLKHAQADMIEVSIDYKPEEMELTINDNGKGFNIAEIMERDDERHSTGIRNIYHRSHLINALVSIKSELTKGTSITVNIPHTPSSLSLS